MGLGYACTTQSATGRHAVASDRGSELFEYAEDSPSELAGQAVKIWRRQRRDCTFPRNFVEKYTAKWAWLVR
jgi:hypothetical protein